MKRVYKRILSVVLALTVAVGSVCWRPPKAKAVVIDATAAFGAAAAAAAVNGTTATTLFTGMGTSAATGSMIGLMDTYAVATGVAASGTALASTIATGILVAGGTLLVGAAAAALIAGFIDWLREEKGLEAGGDPVVAVSDVGYYDKYGSFVSFGLIDKSGSIISYGSTWYPISMDMSFTTTTPLITIPFSKGDLCVKGDYDPSFGKYYLHFTVAGSTYSNWGNTSRPVSAMPVLANNYYHSIGFIVRFSDGSERVWNSYDSTGFYSPNLVGYVEEVNSTVSMQPNPEFIEIPNEIPEGLVLSVDTGLSALPQDDPQAIADAIMQSAIDGALDPSVSVVTDPTVTPEPDPGTDPEPGGAETTSWLSRILESIKSLPQQIAEAISSIFVPSPDFFPTAISNLKDTYSDRMGLLTYPISILFDFLDRILNLNDQPPILRWDSIYLPGYSSTPIVAAGSYNLNDTLSTTAGRRVHDVYLVIVDAMMIVAFLDLCRRKYQKIIHN